MIVSEIFSVSMYTNHTWGKFLIELELMTKLCELGT